MLNDKIIIINLLSMYQSDEILDFNESVNS